MRPKIYECPPCPYCGGKTIFRVKSATAGKVRYQCTVCGIYNTEGKETELGKERYDRYVALQEGYCPECWRSFH